ncbi:MAG: hypothetical protein AB7F36_10000 [Reyranellaceae bacterium]
MSLKRFRGLLRRWRLPLVWIAILAISTAVQTFTVLDDARKVGFEMSLTGALLREISSHFMWLMLLPAIYWLNRRFPIQRLSSIPVHALATVPVSLAHVLGMVALRWIFAGPLNVPFSYAFTVEHLLYEYRKDLMTYTPSPRPTWRWTSSSLVSTAKRRPRPLTGPRSRLPVRSSSPNPFRPARGCGASLYARRIAKCWYRSTTSTGSRPPATMPSCMSARNGTRSAQP